MCVCRIMVVVGGGAVPALYILETGGGWVRGKGVGWEGKTIDGWMDGESHHQEDSTHED